MRFILILIIAYFPFSLLAQAPQYRGVTLPFYSYYEDFDYGPLVKEIAGTGANSINLIVPLLQENGSSTSMDKKKGRSPNETTIRRTIRQSQQEGLDVFLMPIVLFDQPRGDEWRGSMEPADLDQWFRNYTSWIIQFAQLADEEKVAWLSIGSEFSSLEEHTLHWKSLIREVRTQYNGGLLYSCNWDHLEGPEAWWNDLDAVGLSSYYELTTDNDATQEDLNAGWAKWQKHILEWKENSEITPPLIFTEVGYPSMDGGAVLPWNYTLDQAADWDEQAMAYRAFITTWDGHDEVAGVYFYKWVSFMDDETVSYSPKGKPAEQLIKDWYLSSRIDHDSETDLLCE